MIAPQLLGLLGKTRSGARVRRSGAFQAFGKLGGFVSLKSSAATALSSAGPPHVHRRAGASTGPNRS